MISRGFFLDCKLSDVKSCVLFASTPSDPHMWKWNPIQHRHQGYQHPFSRTWRFSFAGRGHFSHRIICQLRICELVPLCRLKKWKCIYPVYINSKKTVVEGRKIKKEKVREERDYGCHGTMAYNAWLLDWWVFGKGIVRLSDCLIVWLIDWLIDWLINRATLWICYGLQTITVSDWIISILVRGKSNLPRNQGCLGECWTQDHYRGKRPQFSAIFDDDSFPSLSHCVDEQIEVNMDVFDFFRGNFTQGNIPRIKAVSGWNCWTNKARKSTQTSLTVRVPTFSLVYFDRI